jgi:hypothetical protein
MPIVRRMPRVQAVVLPLLRARLDPSITCTSWISDIDHGRTWPAINVRRLGGLPKDIDWLDRPVIELTAYSDVGLVETEDLLLDAQQVLWDAWKAQTQTDYGYIHSYFETMGPTQFDSPYDDTWRVQALIQLGLRPKQV